MAVISGLVTMQGVDRSVETQQVAEQYGMLPRGMVAQFIAESSPKFNEQSARYGIWPDVSFGGYQQTVAYAPVGDHSASAQNIAYVRDYFFNYSNAVRVAAQHLAGYYSQFIGEGLSIQSAYLEAASRYNGGSRMAFADNPNRAHIWASWLDSENYMVEGGTVQPWQPIDARDRFPYANGLEYTERDVASIKGVVYHHGDSANPDPNEAAELDMLDQYYQLHIANDGVHGWPSIGYGGAVGPSGNAYLVNGPQLITYHAGNWQANVDNFGIVFIGNYTHEIPGPAMVEAAIRLRHWVAALSGQGDIPYTGHQDWYPTACPGEWWPSSRGMLESLATPNEPDPETGATPGASVADLVSQIGYLTGDLANGLETDAYIIRKLATGKKAREAIDAGLLPKIATLKRGGA